MSHRITRASGTEPSFPVTMDEIKAHLRMTDDSEDDLLSTYRTAAHDWVEEATHRAITQRSFLVVMDDFPRDKWQLPLGYVASITKVEYIDSDGNTNTWGASNYYLDNASDTSATLMPVPAESWPDVGQYPSSARITLVAGWVKANVPGTIRAAVLQRVAQLAESRAPGDPEADVMEKATRSMLAPWVLPIWA